MKNRSGPFCYKESYAKIRENERISQKMSRTEFLKALRQKLSESMSPREVDEQVRYYDNYIREAIKNGQREEEVMASLGDPVLIARTILEAPGGSYYSDNSGNSSTSRSENNDYGYEERPSAKNTEEKVKIKKISSLGCIVAAVIFALAMFLILRLVGVIIGVIFRIAAPVLLVILLIVLIRNLNHH